LQRECVISFIGVRAGAVEINQNQNQFYFRADVKTLKQLRNILFNSNHLFWLPGLIPVTASATVTKGENGSEKFFAGFAPAVQFRGRLKKNPVFGGHDPHVCWTVLYSLANKRFERYTKRVRLQGARLQGIPVGCCGTSMADSMPTGVQE